MKWDYPPLDTNPAFPGLGGVIIIIVIIFIIIIIIIIAVVVFYLTSVKMHINENNRNFKKSKFTP